MATTNIQALANIIYPVLNAETKEEIQAVASCLVRSPENYNLSDFDTLIDGKKVDELAFGKFVTSENETTYKKILSVLSAILRGTLEIMQCDILIPREQEREFKKSGRLESLTKTGKAGAYGLYIINENNQN